MQPLEGGLVEQHKQGWELQSDHLFDCKFRWARPGMVGRARRTLASAEIRERLYLCALPCRADFALPVLLRVLVGGFASGFGFSCFCSSAPSSYSVRKARSSRVAVWVPRRPRV